MEIVPFSTDEPAGLSSQSRRRALVLAGLLLVTVAAGCGGDDKGLLTAHAALPQTGDEQSTGQLSGQSSGQAAGQMAGPADDGAADQTAGQSMGQTKNASMLTGYDSSLPMRRGQAAPGLNTLQAAMLAMVNDARVRGARCGVENMPSTAPLHWHAQLEAAARGHSVHMKESGDFSHTGQNQSSAADRLSATGYSWSVVGENIAAGFRDPSSVMRGWMASAGHCRNIMNPRFISVAVVLVDANPDVGFNTYWTMVLAAPEVIAANR